MVKIYPNPVSDILYVDTELSYEIEIIDIFGQIVSHEVLEVGQNKLDLKGYSSGVYFIKIKDPKNFQIKKFIIE